jgi:hypothetical protein
MLLSNGKKIILRPQTDIEDVAKVAQTLKKRAKDFIGKNATFSVHEEPFQHISNDSDLEWNELKQLCIPDMEIQFRAIGNDKVRMPEARLKEVKFKFTLEEKNEIAIKFCNAQFEKEQLEAEAKEVAKEFKTKINEYEQAISELSTKYREGSEYRTIECDVHLDFEGGVKIYTDIASGEVVHSEPLTIEDQQLKIEF